MVTFAEKFCADVRVTPDRYEAALFWRCLHRRALPFAGLIRWLAPAYFEPDLELIRGVGRLTSADDLDAELDDFYSHRGNHGFARRRLRIRLSIGRLSKLVYRLLPARPGSSAGHDTRSPM